jgi:hypothetical protein
VSHRQLTIVEEDGRVYSCRELDGEPTLVNVPERIVDVCAGDSHSLMLTDDGKVYGYGSDANGCLGGKGRIDVWSILPDLNHVFVTGISCCYDNTICVTQDGEVWATGCNSFGHLNIGHENNISKFQKAFQNITTKVKRVYCGFFHTIIQDEFNTHYAIGELFGKELKKFEDFVPSDLKEYARSIIAVGLGSEYSIVADKYTGLTVHGVYSSGQLGPLSGTEIEDSRSHGRLELVRHFESLPDLASKVLHGDWEMRIVGERYHSIIYLVPRTNINAKQIMEKTFRCQQEDKFCDITLKTWW